MGRAERRRLERRNRIDDRKNKILMSPSELHRLKEELSYKASEYTTEHFMTCFALTLSRQGFDEDDIEECVRCIDTLMSDLLSGKATMEDYIKELEDSTGIVIKCEEDNT